MISPTFNERENLALLVPAVLAVRPDIDVLVIDDASPDGTGELADEMAAAEPRVHVMHRAGKLGLGTAFVQGFRWALEKGYDRVVDMDADLSHRPEDLPAILAASDAGAGLVVGSRNMPGGRVEGWSWVRKLISRWGSFYARTLLRLPLRDCTSGYKCLSRQALESIDVGRLQSNGYAFNVEINHLCHRAGVRLAEVPIVFPDRVAGKSKMTLGIIREAAVLVLRWRLGRAV